MTRTYLLSVLVALFALGTCLVFPAPDLPETPYDESEAEPYEPIASVTDSAPVTVASPDSRNTILGAIASTIATTNELELLPRRSSHADTPRFLSPRVALALLCTLIC